MFLTGRITITAGERAVDETSMPGTLGRAAFAILALERRRLSHDELAERLWPADTPLDSAKLLAPLISKLRTPLRTMADDSGHPTIDHAHGDLPRPAH